ncbi:hypothetical protein [Flavobacterium xinjiangense]|uniref:Uncharacterized protein n=1 Tax=Flavobacterium xinjiangense TaxID=178356 RepID=A0A1M7L2E4_9FLAO|nr:hypothetical protein [Flavobacterium xinjiangense]SHM72077.1 hypothetical protein SAMN05216269_106161 [Flavobacterium xinjiangense]
MEIFNSQGKNITKSGVLVLNKAIGSVIFSSSLDVEALTTEQIKIEVEKLTGNEEITKGYMDLKDFIYLTTFKGDAITSDVNYKTTAQCEICEDGAIQLGEKDVIKIELIGLKTAETYVINGIEEPQTSVKTLSFENKSMSQDDKSKTFEVAHCDLAILDNADSIIEVAYTYEGGVVVKYTLHELRVLSRSIDPLAYVRQDGSVKCAFASKIQLPLFGVNSIEVRKAQGSIVNLIVRREA